MKSSDCPIEKTHKPSCSFTCSSFVEDPLSRKLFDERQIKLAKEAEEEKKMRLEEFNMLGRLFQGMLP